MLFRRPFRRDPEHTSSAWSDIAAVFRQQVDHRWAFLLASIAIPGLLLTAFMVQYGNKKADYRPPEVIFFDNWKANRSDAEVRAKQLKDAPAERAAREAQAEAEARHRQKMQELARDLGIEVEK
jgi:hypothetical protein